MGDKWSFPGGGGIKRSGREADHLAPSSVERVQPPPTYNRGW